MKHAQTQSACVSWNRTGMIQLTARLGTVWLEFILKDYGTSPTQDFLNRKRIEPVEQNLIKPLGLDLS
jgi:hypothetical protein